MLESDEVEVVQPEDVPTEAPIADFIAEEIRRADFVCVLLSRGSGKSNALVELGMARQARKPTIVLTADDEPLPFVLQDTVTLPFGKERTALREHLQAFIQHRVHDSNRNRYTTSRISPSTRQPNLAWARQALKLDLKDQPMARQQRVISTLAKVLKEAGGQIVKSPGPRDEGADLVVWWDELEGVVGNPIAFEVKGRLGSHAEVSDQAHQLWRFLKVSGASFGFVLYDGPEYTLTDLTSRSVAAIPIDRFLLELEQGRLAKYLRNRQLQTV